MRGFAKKVGEKIYFRSKSANRHVAKMSNLLCKSVVLTHQSGDALNGLYLLEY